MTDLYTISIVSPLSGAWEGHITDIFCPDVVGGQEPVIRAAVRGDFGPATFIMASDGSCCIVPDDRRVHPILSYAPGELDVRYTMPEENIALA